MFTYMLVRHKVEDYPAWKRAYDAHLQKRMEAGLTERHLFRSDDDLNEVWILFEAEDINRARKFAESVDLRWTMEKAGVIGKPDIFFLDDQSRAYAKASGY